MGGSVPSGFWCEVVGKQAYAQLVVTFSEEEAKSILSEIENYANATGAGKSGAAKTYLKAAMGDELARQTIETFRKMKGFTAAVRLAAPKAVMA